MNEAKQVQKERAKRVVRKNSRFTEFVVVALFIIVAGEKLAPYILKAAGVE